MTETCTIVGGNGPSLARIAPGRALAGDAVVRINNFFFEPFHYLGNRVDLAVIGGDPRVAPFVFETLQQQCRAYDLRGWTSPDARLIGGGRRRVHAPYRPIRYHPAHAALVRDLSAAHGLKPTTGIYAVMAALALAPRPVILAGMDLYTGDRRYAYEPGRHQRDLLGADLDRRGYDTRLHSRELDRRILGALAARDDVTLWRSTEDGPLAGLMDLAPPRTGPAMVPVPRIAPGDWAGRTGLYPVAGLKLMRRVRARQRQLMKR